MCCSHENQTGKMHGKWQKAVSIAAMVERQMPSLKGFWDRCENGGERVSAEAQVCFQTRPAAAKLHRALLHMSQAH